MTKDQQNAVLVFIALVLILIFLGLMGCMWVLVDIREAVEAA